MNNGGISNIQFNSAGFKAILESGGVKDMVQDTANQICERANANNERGGQGFGVKVKHLGYGGGRWGAFIYAKDAKATQAESEEKALTKAVTG